MDIATLITGIVGGTIVKTVADFVIQLLTNRKESYDNWQEDREFYRKTFNEMQEQVRTLSNRVVTLEQFILKHSMELPA
jgi:hypothetical protein